jgi:hypothetical protein
MKTKINTKETKKAFKPFTIEFTAESIEDARLLFHLTNCEEMNNMFINNSRYYFDKMGYSKNVSSQLDTTNIYCIIRDIVESQGFKI